MKKQIEHLVGHINQVTSKTTPNLFKTELFELITQNTHGAAFSFNLLKLLPEGLIKEQSHPEQHVIFILNGKCEILLGERWLRVQTGNYLYVPADTVHAFKNNGEMPVEVLIFKI